MQYTFEDNETIFEDDCMDIYMRFSDSYSFGLIKLIKCECFTV